MPYCNYFELSSTFFNTSICYTVHDDCEGSEENSYCLLPYGFQMRQIATICITLCWLLSAEVHAEPEISNPRFFTEMNERQDVYHRVSNEWLECQKVSECALIKGFCGRWTPVNKAHQKQFEEWVRNLNNAASCIHVSGPLQELVCRNKLCDYEIIHSEQSHP